MSAFHTLAVSSIRHETRDTLVVSFEVPPSLREVYRFTQGQYLTLRAMVDGRDMRRAYSICSATQEDELRIAIKRVADGCFSTWAHLTLKPGAQLDVIPPMGHFHTGINPESRRHYLAIAAGSGITPILSIIKTTLMAEPHSRFTLLYGNRASSSVIFKNELCDLKDTHLGRLRLVHVMSRELQDLDLLNGRIDFDKCTRLFERWIPIEGIDFAFVCGPQAMMQAACEALHAHGLPRDRIKTELFAAPPAIDGKRLPMSSPRSATGVCEVTLVMDGARSRFTMDRGRESVLDAALRQGIDVRYACKAGVCATCCCKVIEGAVDMDANHALEDYEVARGLVLSCQSHPASEHLVIDFDQGH